MLGLRTLNPSRLAVIMTALLLLHLIPIDDASASSTRVPGMDVGPVAAMVSYTSNADHTNHAALSSQDPSSIGMNRDADLWIVDGMYMISQDIDVTIENFGDTTATSFNVKIEVLHDEYANFILYTQTLNVASLAPSAQTTISTTWMPDYSGNHTLRITTLLANDADNSNDVGTRTLTIGNIYDRAEVSGSWTLGQNWYVSSEASLSGSNSFHVGGSTSTTNYGINWDTSLESAIIDTSDAHPNPSRGFGIGFFYTGEAVDTDGFDIDVWNGNSWQRITSTTVTSSVDTEFATGSNWLINLNTVNGFGVPWWNIPASAMNSQFKFRFNFHTNGAGNSIGYWFEDIVLFYDQKAKPEEFAIGGNTGQAGHARAGEWAETVLTATNQGNLTDEIDLSVENLPLGWNYKFQHMTGSMIPEGVGIQLAPGESRNFKLLVQPDEGSSLGSTSVTVKFQSSEPSVSKSLTASFVVDPDFEPTWVEQDPAFYCLPGNLCQFQITLNNDGDEEDTFTLASSVVLSHNEWTFGMHYDQSPIVTIPSGSSQIIDLTANLPVSALPGMKASTMFTATSHTDPSKSASVRANVTASMVSSGHVGVSLDDIPSSGWWISPGDTITIPFTIWNNASQQDTYSFSFDTSGVFGWTVGLPSTEDVVIAPSGTAVVMLSFTAPITALANDPGPIITPHAISTASGMSTTESVFSSIRVRQHHDLNLTIEEMPDSQIRPGIPVEIPFMVENLGNGADSASIDLQLPDSWQWWFEMDETTLNPEQLPPIPLSTIHDGANSAELSIWVLVPTNEQPGDIFDLELSVSSTLDEMPEGSASSISWQYQTMMMALPHLEPFMNQDVSAWLEQSLEFNLVVANTGNTFDASLRVRVSASSSQNIFVTLDSSRTGVDGTLNSWMDLPMSPGANETLTISFVSTSAFPLGETIQLTVEVEGGMIGANDPLISSSTSINITVNQKRQLDVAWDLLVDDEIKPNQPKSFNIDVSSDSTMAVRVTLDSIVPADAVLDCTPASTNGTVELLLPAAEQDAQTGIIECQITLAESDLKQTLTLHLHDDNDELIWSQIVHLKTEQTEKKSGTFGAFNIEVLGVISGVIFIVFVIVMAAMIIRRMNRLDSFEFEDDEDYEGEGDVQVQAEQVAPVAAIQQQAAAPGPMPGAPGPMPALQVAPAQVAAAVNVAPSVEPAAQAEQPGPESYSDDELRTAGWSEVQISELRGENQESLSNAFGSLDPGAQMEDSATVAEPNQSLPSFNCIVTGSVLTAADSWWQCSHCSGFAEIGAIGQYTSCPACNTPF